jgi:hypothetical protein
VRGKNVPSDVQSFDEKNHFFSVWLELVKFDFLPIISCKAKKFTHVRMYTCFLICNSKNPKISDVTKIPGH